MTAGRTCRDAALLGITGDLAGPAIHGVRNAQQLAAVNCAAALRALLDYRQRQALDELAPTHLTVPSGSRIRLDYCAGDLPVLAVKLQELFGLAETPTIAGGRVRVLLHLLSPAGRPITGDEGFEGVLGWFLSPGEKGDEGALPQASLAG